MNFPAFIIIFLGLLLLFMVGILLGRSMGRIEVLREWGEQERDRYHGEEEAIKGYDEILTEEVKGFWSGYEDSTP